MLIASSASLDGLLRLVVRFYAGSSIRFEGSEVFNANGRIDGVRVICKRGRWRFERI